MNTILNLYIRKENLEFRKPLEKFRNLEIFDENLEIFKPLEKFNKFGDF